MPTPRTSLIAAFGARTRAIGRAGGLLWSLPTDMRRFKELTTGHPVVMGRKTWESLPERFRPLPGRPNFVVTRDQSYKAPGAIVAYSLESALAQARAVPDNDEVFVIGGGQLYAEALALAERLYLTLVDDDAEGDVFFPDYPEFTRVVEETRDEENGLPYTFLTLERKT